VTTKAGADKNARIEQLMREAAAAAKAGDRATAKNKYREVTELDDKHERAWLLLASVSDDVEEKRTCLGNVLIINPENARAKELLEQLDRAEDLRASRPRRPTQPFASSFSTSGTSKKSTSGATISPANEGMRRTLTIMGGVILVGLLAVVLLFRNPGAPPEPTSTSIPPTLTATDDPKMVTATALALQVTEIARQTSQALPPSWTPRPTNTPRGLLTATPLATPPAGISGRLLVMAGKSLSLDGYLPIAMIDLATGTRTEVAENRGADAIFTTDGRIIYGRYVSGSRPQLLLRLQNLGGARPSEINALWGNRPPIADQKQPNLAPTGRDFVFVGRNITENELYSTIYYLQVNFPIAGTPPTATPPPTATYTPTDATETPIPPTETATPIPLQVVRLTDKDSGIHLYPHLAPNGIRVVYTTDTTPIDGAGTDIYVLNLADGLPSGTPIRITNDGDAVIEASPRFSLDGSQIAYTGRAKDSSETTIYLVSGGAPSALVSGMNEIINVRWSPDGQYLGFSSNRSGKWEVYAVHVATQEIYQLTLDPEAVILTDWGN